ncbi:MAG TPA: hypothetical protein DC000_04735 [Clostridiales bacterium]|nr:hypothetical protein [Clostridiales bacterium]
MEFLVFPNSGSSTLGCPTLGGCDPRVNQGLCPDCVVDGCYTLCISNVYCPGAGCYYNVCSGYVGPTPESNDGIM